MLYNSVLEVIVRSTVVDEPHEWFNLTSVSIHFLPGNPCLLTPEQIESDSIDEAIEIIGDFNKDLIVAEITFTKSIERAKDVLLYSEYF